MKFDIASFLLGGLFFAISLLTFFIVEKRRQAKREREEEAIFQKLDEEMDEMINDLFAKPIICLDQESGKIIGTKKYFNSPIKFQDGGEDWKK